MGIGAGSSNKNQILKIQSSLGHHWVWIVFFPRAAIKDDAKKPKKAKEKAEKEKKKRLKRLDKEATAFEAARKKRVEEAMEFQKRQNHTR
ncbi:Protein of unknown function [Pyronema omphalodes CBS 100304]|uniref:Uncharacterized protein n=1 Tax=Pyronema omphalodes (strain CBS 100304) TaxID=1076935 RepID=U4LRQ1_PYROM|nr:Protein of unknown function [Pyronema omphalodes CBS 100304]